MRGQKKETGVGNEAIIIISEIEKLVLKLWDKTSL